MDEQRIAVVPEQLNQQPHYREDVLPAAYGPRLLWMSDRRCGGADVYVTSRAVQGLDAPAKPNVEPHVHRVSQTHLFLGDPGSLEVEIEVGDGRGAVRSPASVFVQAGTRHWIRILRGGGDVVSIVRDSEYS